MAGNGESEHLLPPSVYVGGETKSVKEILRTPVADEVAEQAIAAWATARAEATRQAVRITMPAWKGRDHKKL